MFQDFRDRRRLARAVSDAVGRLRGAARLDPVDAAATAAIANALLVRLSDDTGVDLRVDPSALPTRVAAEVVERLVRHHDALAEAVPEHDEAIGDVLGAQAVRQARAALVAASTVGAGSSAGARAAAVGAWRSLRTKRPAVRREAVRSLRVFARTARKRPLARMASRPNDAAEVFRLTGEVPSVVVTGGAT